MIRTLVVEDDFRVAELHHAYVGRVTGIKRPDRLVDVARMVHREIPSAQFVVCGDGDLSRQVAAAATDLDGVLHLLGYDHDSEEAAAAMRSREEAVCGRSGARAS